MKGFIYRVFRDRWGTYSRYRWKPKSCVGPGWHSPFNIGVSSKRGRSKSFLNGREFELPSCRFLRRALFDSKVLFLIHYFWWTKNIENSADSGWWCHTDGAIRCHDQESGPCWGSMRFCSIPIIFSPSHHGVHSGWSITTLPGFHHPGEEMWAYYRGERSSLIPAKHISRFAIPCRWALYHYMPGQIRRRRDSDVLRVQRVLVLHKTYLIFDRRLVILKLSAAARVLRKCKVGMRNKYGNPGRKDA